MIRVSDLAGAELALWVAKAEGHTINGNSEAGWVRDKNAFLLGYLGDYCVPPLYAPHKDWSQAGPLIAKYRIWLQPVDAGGTWMGEQQRRSGWLARVAGAAVNERDIDPLIAAMRALVASVYGEEVES